MDYSTILLGVQLALLLAIVYSLRKIYSLEYRIIDLDVKIEKILKGKKK